MLFINADDELCSDALEILYRTITNNPGFDVYSGTAMIIDKKENLKVYLLWSNELKRASFGSCIVVQQATCLNLLFLKKLVVSTRRIL